MALDGRDIIRCLRGCQKKPLSDHVFKTKRQVRTFTNLRTSSASICGPAEHRGVRAKLQSKINHSSNRRVAGYHTTLPLCDLPRQTPPLEHRAFIALGSNIGDRVKEIEQACRAMERRRDIRITRTSSLRESEPMYVQDQSRFLNGVCEIQTSLKPIELLDRLQSIERDLGRVKLIDKGPRNIDLDILLYDRAQIETERLSIPHKLMSEREFVLRPLCQLAANETKPASPGTEHELPNFKTQLRQLWDASKETPRMDSYTPMAASAEPLRATSPTKSTQVMSILNITPDSFSDGGENMDLSALRPIISSQIADGASIIDIGGESTRPGATPVTPEEELKRIMPVIKLCKQLNTTAAISVDTYRASVARAAVEAGADIINDVGGGTLDPDMFSTIADLGCTYILMHMRGTLQTMNSRQNTTYSHGLINKIGGDLSQRLAAAQEAGIRRWRIILDPGIGFSKKTTHNLEILKNLQRLRARPELSGVPWLVGSSRKRFIGEVTGVEDAKQRIWGSAVAVAAAIQGGADIVRVHDVKEMTQVAKMADAIWRGTT